MEFYKIKNKGLHLSNKLFQDDIVFIIDGIAGYIWKGKNAVEMDELTAKEVEKIINDKFKDMSFNLIMDLDIKKTENLKIAQIKREILKRLPRSTIEKKSKHSLSTKPRLRRIYENLKDYDVSIEFRKKISSRLTLWKLSLFNCLIIIACIVILLDLTFFHFLNNNSSLLIALIFLIIMLGANLLFIFFPMKFPKKFISQNRKGEDYS